MSATLKKDLVNGTIWSLIGQFGYLAVALIANIILARLLSPKEFGQMGIALFFIVIARVITESGLGGALVRNNRATDIDFSTIFLFNLLVSIVLCLLLVFSAGFVAEFYKDETLENILIASSCILVINAFQFVQGARLDKNMQFKRKAIYEFVAISIAATVGVILGFLGYGVWAIVFMQLSTAFLTAIMFWVFEGGFGPWIFNKDSFKKHYKFGVNTTAASMLNSVFDNIYQLILGKYFAITQTGLYYQSKKLQEITIGVINKLTQGVFFSGLSKIQDDKVKFNTVYQRVFGILTVAVGLICLMLFMYSSEIILLLLGERWLQADFFLKILALSSFFYIQEMFNRILFKIYNRTDIILKLELIKKSVQVVSVLIGLSYMSIDILMFGFLVSSIISYFINYYFSRRLIDHLGSLEMINLLKSIIVGVFICIIFLGLKTWFNFHTLTILFTVLPVSVLFIGLLSLWNVFSLKEGLDLIRFQKND